MATTLSTAKITSILSSSFANIEIRDALEALDARHIQNTATTRRNLRLDLQEEAIQSNAEIIHDFGDVANQLRNVGVALANLQNTVNALKKHVTAAKLETAPMLDEADTLLQKQRQVEAKKHLLHAFRSHFVLEEQKLLVLTSTAEPVNDEFFAALVKAKRIHKDCQVLLTSENQRLGLEILEQSTKNMNAAFQKLYRWVQREFKMLDLENPQLNASLRRAVRVLAERPTLFQNCLDTFAEARQKTLFDAFYGALTGSALVRRGSEAQKPIEFSMHEPLRYVGDMLAWVHSTAVSERETLEGLFVSEGDEIARGIREGLESEPWSRQEEDEAAQETFDGKKTLGRLVDRGLAGAAQLLKQRVDQVVQSHNDAVLAYKVSNLITFYKGIFMRLVESADFIATLDHMHATATDHYCTAMRMHITSISSDATFPEDASVPPFLEDALAELRALISSYETSAASASASDAALALIIDEALKPYLGLVQSLADTAASPSTEIFGINCFQSIRGALTPFRTIMTAELDDMDTSIASQASQLQVFLQSFMLEQSGLAPLVAELRDVRNVENITAALQALLASQVFSFEGLEEVAHQLDAFLPSAVIDANGEVGRLRDKVLLAQIVGRASDGFKDEFEEVVAWIERLDEFVMETRQSVGSEQEGEDEMPMRREVFPRTVEEVGILLS